MDRNPRFIVFTTLVLVYAIAIFILSSIPKVPLPPQYYEIPNPDKLAHTAIYFGFGILLCLSFGNASRADISDRAIPFTLVIGIVYGILDEVHQGFVPGRTASHIDIAFNTLGILLAVVAYWLYDKRIKQQSKNV
jgi:VanZ family protein